MASINTIEDINMAFEETIAVGELALEDSEEESNSSYKHKDMAIFVEEMSKLTNNTQDIETPPAHSRENSVNLQDNQSDTGSVIRHGDSGSETGSINRYDSGVVDTESFSISQQSNDLQAAVVERDQEKISSVVEHKPLSSQRSSDSVTDKEVSEITYNFMIDAVPTEFQNDGEAKKVDQDEPMEEEETWVETIEEIDIKLTPDMVEAMEKGRRENETRLAMEKLKTDNVAEKEISSIKVELVSASVVTEAKPAKKSETNQMENVNSLRDSYLKRRDRSPPPVVKPKTSRQRIPTSDGPTFKTVTSKPTSNVRPVTPPKPVVRPPTPPKGRTRTVSSPTQLKESFTVVRPASPPKETFRVVRPPTPPKQQTVKSSFHARKEVRPPTPPKEPAKKEEFVLSFDDLNKVDFLGVKQKLRKTEKVPSIQLKSQNDKSVDIKSFEEREKIAKMQNDSTGIYGLEGSMRGVKGSVKNRCSELSFAPNNDEELDSVLEEKSISMMALPAQRSVSDEEYRMASESEEEKFTSKASMVIASPRLDTDSGYGNSLDRSYVSDRSFQPSTPDASLETTSPTGDIQQQFATWQQQLLQNQQLLSNQTVDPTAMQVQQMQKQLEMQQQLMLQMQQNLVSLTLQNSTADPPAVLPPSQITSEHVRQVEATPAPPPPPPAMNITNVPPKMPSMSASNLKTVPAVAPKTKSKANPKRFEQKLAPREELMIAIRNYGGRTDLKKVPIKQTNW